MCNSNICNSNNMYVIVIVIICSKSNYAIWDGGGLPGTCVAGNNNNNNNNNNKHKHKHNRNEIIIVIIYMYSHNTMCNVVISQHYYVII